MQNNYAGFLEYRAAQRHLAAKFARPRMLLLHVLAFVVVMTATWVYGGAWGLWSFRDNFIAPVLVGLIWSLALAGHALLHYRRSAANPAQREQAVEDEMRRFIAQNTSITDAESLFEMHRSLESRLEAQARWSFSLGAFALVNAVSWAAGAANIGSSWPFQMTLIFAVVIIGSIQAYMLWQQQRETGRKNWFTRLPLWHVFAYLTGILVLALLGALRAINPWDVNTLAEWGLVLLLAHIAWSVVLQPVVLWLGGRQTKAKTPAKHKPGHAMTLGEDGELVDLPDDSAAPDADAYVDEAAARGSATGG